MSIGDTLAEARRQAGLTITQVSQQTRIRESIIRAIEQGDYSPCGGDFYARGHIRSIASVVGTDPAPLIREYDDEHGPPGAMRAAQVFEPATPIRIREPRRFGWGKALAVLLLAVIGYGAYHLVSTHDSHSNASQTDTLRPTAPPTPHPSTSASASASASARPVAHAPARPEAVIKLVAIEDCWVALTNASGQQLYEGTILAGNTMVWKELHPVSMVIGNPGGIVLTVDGKTETLSTVQVDTVAINPSSKTPVTMGGPPGTVTAVSASAP